MYRHYVPLHIKTIAGCVSLSIASVSLAAQAAARIAAAETNNATTSTASGTLPDGPQQPPEDESAPSLEEVVVSARKRSERLIDIPESITALSAAELESKGIATVEDLGRQTPNLQLNMRQDMTTDVVIRGVGAYGDVLGVGFVIDNVQNFTDQTMPVEDLESVEILKGPQGTLYGGSSIGGLIRYVAKKPEFNWDGEASVELGSYSHISTHVAQNFPLIDQKLALRISAYDLKDDGWFTNSALNIDPNPTTSYGVRAALLFKPTDDLEALLTLRHAYMRNGSDMYVPVPSVTSYTFDAPFFQPTYNTRNVNGGVLELNENLGAVKLTSISSYASAMYTINADISQSPPGLPGQSLYTVPGNRPATVATQELRITSPSGRHVDWIFGLYGASIQNILLNKLGASSYPPPADPAILNDFDTNRTDLAGFGSATFAIGSFRLETGARYSQTRFHTNVFVEAGGLPDQSASITSHGFLPKVSLSYPLSGDGRVYATLAKGEEPGAVNTVSVAPIPYRSETALSREVGLKAQTSDHRADIELAAFYVTNDNHQVQTNLFNAAEGGLITLVNNIGNSRTYGLELGTNWRATDSLSFGLDGGYLNAKWRQASVFGASIDGNTVPNSPEVSGAFTVDYTMSLSNNLLFTTRFDTNYTDAMWWDLPNTPGSKEGPHFFSNLRFALGQEGRGWQVVVRATNLLNAHYWTEYGPNFFPPNALPCAGCNNYGAIGAPRQFFASLTYKH